MIHLPQPTTARVHLDTEHLVAKPHLRSVGAAALRVGPPARPQTRWPAAARVMAVDRRRKRRKAQERGVPGEEKPLGRWGRLFQVGEQHAERLVGCVAEERVGH